MHSWDHNQYLKFEDERTRPARELLARVALDAAARVVDLGCGPGNSTRLLRNRWPTARIIGVDSSHEMLERARADWPTGDWRCSDAQSFCPDGPTDLLFANALFQWIPEHDAVFPRLVNQLRVGGVLAVQMPYNFSEPSHRLMRELGEPWNRKLSEVRYESPVLTTQRYYDLLAPCSTRVDIWQTTYEHVMPDVSSIVDWVKGTGIRPYLAVLSEQEQVAYLQQYARAIDTAYPQRADGKRLFSFTRIFIVAVR